MYNVQKMYIANSYTFFVDVQKNVYSTSQATGQLSQNNSIFISPRSVCKVTD